MNRLSYFCCDITPPVGHPLVSGLCPPAEHIVDQQWAQGVILAGESLPIVIVSMDWCENRNSAYAMWREALASAVGTEPHRIFVHTVHQHDAILADPGIEELLAANGLAGLAIDMEFFRETIQRVAQAAREACRNCQPLTHISRGEAQVEQVASNRRVDRDEKGNVLAMRGSRCIDKELRAKPEGLIDPMLRTIGFWNGEQLLAVFHYYATHPMSFYGGGGVSKDFCGLARERLANDFGVPQLYFTGGAGNIAAGKYNDGTPDSAAALVERMFDGMRRSLQSSVREPLTRIDWQSEPIQLFERAEYPASFYRTWLEDEQADELTRCWGAVGLASLKYMEEVPGALDISCLHLNEMRVLQLPGEPFIEYQLFAQQEGRGRFVAFAGYGDGGPGYLPTAIAYEEGGYETSWVTFTDARGEGILKTAIQKLLSA